MKNLIATCLLLIATISYGQMGSLAISLGFPQNEFQENTDAVGFGLDLSAAMPFQDGVPIYFGLDLNYMIYGRNADHEDLFANVTSSNGTLLTTIEIPLKIVNTNSLFGTHAFIRAVAPFDNVQPYAEGLIGFRYISTNTKILDRSPDRIYSSDDDDVIVRKTVLDDFIFSYGYGGGVMIQLNSVMSLDFRVDFFKGQRAEYFDGTDTEAWSVEFTGADPTNIQQGDLDFSTETRKSTTDMLVFKFGVVGRI